VKEYIYAYALSRENQRKVIAKHNPLATLFLITAAILIISIPARQQADFAVVYAYNFLIIGLAVIIINAFMAVLISYLTKKNAHEIMFGLLHMTAVAFIINSIILMILYIIGMPFGVSSILWAAAATLISTYYFIVLLAVCAGSIIDEEKKGMMHAVEVVALLLWYAFTFYILPLTA